jgi:hypothetical protein
MEHLLQRAARRPADTGIMAGLVTICRYAGLLGPSLAAHDRAVASDPTVRTSVCWTHFFLGDFDGAIRTDIGSPPFAALFARLVLGQLDGQTLIDLEQKMPQGAHRLGVSAHRHIDAGLIEQGLEDLEALRASGFSDPEGWFLYSWTLARKGAVAEARELLTRSVESGYACYDSLATRPEWDVMRDDAGFKLLMDRTRVLVAESRAVYERAGGPALLGQL